MGFILKPEEAQKDIFVHSWESHDEPRVVKFVNGMLFTLKIFLVNSDNR